LLRLEGLRLVVGLPRELPGSEQASLKTFGRVGILDGTKRGVLRDHAANRPHEGLRSTGSIPLQVGQLALALSRRAGQLGLSALQVAESRLEPFEFFALNVRQ